MARWAGQKGYVATTVGEGCVLGVGLTASADDAHLEEAYGLTSHACIQSRVTAKTGLPIMHQLGASAQRPRWRR